MDELDRSATTIGPLRGTIEDNFGLAHEALIRVFLDNRPSGYKREPELHAYEALVPEGHEDRVLRLNTERFARNMKLIVARALDDDSVYAPFKSNWLSKIRQAQDAGAE